MVEKKVKTLDGKLSISIPSTIDEITLGQVMKMQENPSLNDLEAISILSGIPLGQLQNIKNIDDLYVFGEVILQLSNQVKYLYAKDQIPGNITFNLEGGRKTINVIQNLSVEPAGAFFAAREIIAEEINEHLKKYGQDDWQLTFNPSLKACCQVLAHYFYCKATGKKYNEYEAEEFSNEIKKMRVTEAMPIARHFFHGDKLAGEVQADALFRNTLGQYEDTVNRRVKVPLSQNQFDALVSFTYNVGTGGLEESTLLVKLNDRNYNEAAAHFLAWDKITDPKTGEKVASEILLQRRKAESRLFLTPDKPSITAK